MFSLVPSSSLIRSQRVVGVDNERTVSVVDPAAFAAAQALERNGHEQVTMGYRWYSMQLTGFSLEYTTDQFIFLDDVWTQRCTIRATAVLRQPSTSDKRIVLRVAW